MNVKTYYECQACGNEHESYSDAKSCCTPKSIYRCGECDTYHSGDKEDAEQCCSKENVVDIKGETK